MGCCLPKEMSPNEVINETDSHLNITTVTGGLKLIRRNTHQGLPGGTLFVTNTHIIHCTKCWGYNRIDFQLNQIKDLKSEPSNSCYTCMLFCRTCPDGYISFRAKLDRKEHEIRIKVKSFDKLVSRIERIRKINERELSVILEEREKGK